MDMQGTTDPRKDMTKTESSQEIVTEMQILTDSVERLSSAVGEFGGKIVPILSQPIPSSDNELTLSKELTAPLALQIRDNINRIDVCFAIINDFILRVQL